MTNNVILACVTMLALALRASPFAQSPNAPARAGNANYTQVFYKSGGLRIEAYVYKPAGEGPFPLILYNHGSRDGQDRVEQPVAFIGRLFTSAGYAVVVPERRGYGKSEGPILRDEIGADTNGKMLDRLRRESTDVLAALEFAKTDPTIDTSRVGIIGWSFGGIVSLLAAGQTHAFFAIIDQAGGALTWHRSPSLQSVLRDAARNLRMPILCMDAENDATTEAVRSVCEAARSRGNPAELKIYPPFKPSQNPGRVAPGHLLFTGEGVSNWGQDVVTFFDAYRRR